MQLPPEQGGLSDDDGLMILQTFFDQNTEAMESFFAQKIPALFKRASKLLATGRAK
jgi:hypothetical protein